MENFKVIKHYNHNQVNSMSVFSFPVIIGLLLLAGLFCAYHIYSTQNVSSQNTEIVK